MESVEVDEVGEVDVSVEVDEVGDVDGVGGG